MHTLGESPIPAGTVGVWYGFYDDPATVQHRTLEYNGVMVRMRKTNAGSDCQRSYCGPRDQALKGLKAVVSWKYEVKVGRPRTR